MSDNKSIFDQQREVTLFKTITLIKNIALWVVAGALLWLLYTSFSESLDQMWADRPPLVSKPIAMGTAAQYRTADPDMVVNGIHVSSGMVYDENFKLVQRSCTSCHSSKLITQNRATREGWSQMIDWMQATQGLTDLGKYEVKILDYLEKNYPPIQSGRRGNLDMSNIDWYELN